MEESAAHHALVLTDANFADEVAKFDGVVLVDFWASWCHPCLVMAPFVDELAGKHAGNAAVKVAKLDVDANEQTSMEHRVLSLPTFKVFRNGELVDELIGQVTLETLEDLLKRVLPAPAAA